MTAMWYYQAQRKTGSPPLYHQFDQFNNPANPGILWQDDPKGYRFASTIQVDANWDAYVANVDYAAIRQDYTWKSFALAIMATGQPQFVIIRQSAPPNAGHAMIIYKVDYLGGKMYVADPNYPGNRDPGTGAASIRTITFQGGKFQPYISGLNAKTPGTSFDQIAFAGKSAYVDMAQIQNRWTEFQAGTIGNDRFPPYTLQVDSVGGAALQDGFLYAANPLQVVCRSTVSQKFLSKTDHLQRFYVFDQSGTPLAFADSVGKGVASVTLSPGANKLGFYICGAKDSTLDYYVDFKWITVNSLTISLDPKTLVADLNKEYTFTATVLGSGSTALRYVWNFGDGTPELTQTGVNTAKHTFTAEGAFSVVLKLYNDATGVLLAAASSSVTIPSSLVKDITTSQYAEIYLAASFNADNSYFTSLGGQGVNQRFDLSPPQVIWNGLSFTSNYAYKIPSIGETDTMTVTGTMSGTVSADGKTLTVMSATEDGKHRDIPDTYHYTISLRNVPYSQTNASGGWTGYYYIVNGPTCQNYVSSASLSEKLYNPVTSRYETVNSTSVVYGASSYLEVGLVKKQ